MDPLLTGLALVAGGTVALALVTDSARELGLWLRHAVARPLAGDAGRRAREFWEAASRNAVLLGALGAAYGLAALLASGESPATSVERLGEEVFGPPILGLLLAAACALPACRRAGPAADGAGAAAEETAAPRAPGRRLRLETAFGYALFLAVLGVLFPKSGGQAGLRPVDLLLHAAAWLAVAAGTAAISLYLGEPRRGRSLSVGLSIAGADGALLGLLQALHGFAVARIDTIAAGLVFALSSGVAGLVGLAAVGLPLEDRAATVGEGRRSRFLGYGAAVALVSLVAIAWLMVSTPMTARP